MTDASGEAEVRPAAAEAPDEAGRARELFRSSDFLARAVTGFDPAVCVVTFDSYSDYRGLDRPGFGEAFFRDRRIDAIHVIARANDWYQHEDILKACEAVASAAAGYSHVFSYGSSMGGYAAIRFGALVGAEAAIALSPQYSIDRRSAPFEKRWEADTRRIGFAIERKANLPFVRRAYIAYDPNDLDRRHVDLFRQRTEVVDVAIPDGGHPVTGFLAEAGLLSEFVLGVAGGAIDLEDFTTRAHAARERTPQYWAVLSERSTDLRARVDLAKHALSLAPLDLGYKIRCARALALNGDHSAALALFDEALGEQPTNPVLLANLSEMHEGRGDLAAAVDAARRLVAAHPGTRLHEQRLAYLESRHRIATVVSTIGRAARTGFSAPASALARLVDGAAGAFGAGSASTAAPIEILTTTTPSPPPFVHSWLRHVDLLRDAPKGAVDLMLVGDSHVHHWPETMWGARSIYNFGVAADKTQHVIWRLQTLRDKSVAAREAILLVGVNNLGADDTAAGMAAGILEAAREIQRVAPSAQLHILAIPPCGEALDFRDRERRRANALTRDRRPLEFVEVETLLRESRDGAAVCYEDDGIHFNAHGYEVLTRALVARFAA